MDDTDSKRRNQKAAIALASQFAHRLETDPQFREQMKQAAQRVAFGIQRMHTQISGVVAQFASRFETLQSSIALVAGQVEPMLRSMVDGFKLLPDALRQAVISLAEESWFLSPDMSLTEPSEAAALLMKGAREEANQCLARYFENQLDEIEQRLVDALPSRSALICSALTAHRRGEYSLAIPVLFAQIDGVCFDLANGHLFQSDRPKKKGVPARPETAGFVDALESDVFWTILLSPLGQKIPINFNSKERGEGFKGLNRHLVMHGESLDYGTAINSLKCISLLSYAAWVLKESLESRP